MYFHINDYIKKINIIIIKARNTSNKTLNFLKKTEKNIDKKLNDENKLLDKIHELYTWVENNKSKL